MKKKKQRIGLTSSDIDLLLRIRRNKYETPIAKPYNKLTYGGDFFYDGSSKNYHNSNRIDEDRIKRYRIDQFYLSKRRKSNEET